MRVTRCRVVSAKLANQNMRLLQVFHVDYMCVYCGAWSAPGAVSACCTCHMCWLLDAKWGAWHNCCKRGVGPCRSPIFGVTGHICTLWDMYALTCNKVNWLLNTAFCTY